MNKRVHTKHRLFCIFLLSVMVVCMAFSMPVSAESAESNVTKIEKHTISQSFSTTRDLCTLTKVGAGPNMRWKYLRLC